MTRGGVITGRIVDEFGEPLVGAQPTLTPVGHGAAAGQIQGFVSQTDDRGEYRFAGLRPGPYVVGVKPRYVPRAYDTIPDAQVAPSTWTNVLQGWAAEDDPAVATLSPLPAPEAGFAPTGYATTFYPGVDEGEAQAVVVEAGRERSGVNFRMRTVPMGLLRGSVTGAGNIKELKVTMVPNRGSTGPIGAASSGIDGHFVMPFVPLGAYTLTATAIASQGGERYSAVVTVVVDGQSHTAPLSITLERAR